jgi:hypothetical protein
MVPAPEPPSTHSCTSIQPENADEKNTGAPASNVVSVVDIALVEAATPVVLPVTRIRPVTPVGSVLSLNVRPAVPAVVVSQKR